MLGFWQPSTLEGPEKGAREVVEVIDLTDISSHLCGDTISPPLQDKTFKNRTWTVMVPRRQHSDAPSDQLSHRLLTKMSILTMLIRQEREVTFVVHVHSQHLSCLF